VNLYDGQQLKIITGAAPFGQRPSRREPLFDFERNFFVLSDFSDWHSNNRRFM
jgi:hypothetical protein